MTLLEELTTEYRGCKIKLRKFDNSPDIIWHWEALRNDEKIDDSSDSSGWSDKDRACSSAQNHIDWRLDAELDRQEEAQLERDRWWLERASGFLIDMRGTWPVTISLLGDRSSWGVFNGPYFLCQGQWGTEKQDWFRDRESALAAYQEWEQQEEAGQ